MSYNKNLYHIVFRTHASQPTIIEANERALYSYILSFCENHHVKLYRIGGMPDHIHLFVAIDPATAVSDFVRDLKKASNHFMQEHRELFPMYNGWGKTFCCLSYSIRDKDMIVNYIKNQKEHHKRISFIDELKQILKETGVEYNPDYFQKDWSE